MGWQADPTVKLALGIFGNITAIVLFSSPAPTFWRIIKRRDTEDFRSLPYICCLVNCFFWTYYGLPFITEDAILVTTVNGAGLGLQLVFLSIFIAFAPRKKKVAVSLQLTAVAIFVTTVAVIAVSAFHGDGRSVFVGSFGATCATVMYASPLSIMRQVIRTKSVEYMPFFLSLMAFVNAAAWTSYAIYVVDFFILVPNGLGLCLSVAQLVLYACYWKPSARKDASARDCGRRLDRSQSQIPFNTDKSSEVPEKL